MFNDDRFGFFGVGAGDDESAPDLLTGVVAVGVVVSSAVVVSSGVPNVDVWAPPELLTTTDGPESLTVDEDSDDEDSDADTDVVANADVLGDEESTDAELDPESDADDGSFDSDEVDLEEADDDESSAHATPGVVATAPPMPNATASAPTRPMYLPYPVPIVFANPARTLTPANDRAARRRSAR